MRVADIGDAIGLRPYRVVITAGLETTMHGGRTFHVPKAVLISKLESAMHTRELQVADDIGGKETFRAELQDFQRHVTASGRPTWSAGGRLTTISFCPLRSVFGSQQTALLQAKHPSTKPTNRKGPA